MKFYILIFFIFCSILPYSFCFANDESGGYAGSFLEWGAGARAIALGKTFSAVANDGSALYWNPAGLTQLNSRELSAMHALIFEDRMQNFLSFVYPVNIFALAAGWLRFGVNDIQERDNRGEKIGTFDDAENVFMFGSGISVLSIPTFKLKIGFTAKYFYHALYNYHASCFGGDLGMLSYFHSKGFIKRIGVGFTVQNLGAKLKWDTESSHEDNIPIIFRGGAAVNLNLVPFKILLDLEKKENQQMRIHAGAEYWIRMLALRAGLDHNNLTVGAGLVFKLPKGGLIIDYAYTNDDISNKGLHFFSLNLRF
jgi:hypothetical protein